MDHLSVHTPTSSLWHRGYNWPIGYVAIPFSTPNLDNPPQRSSTSLWLSRTAHHHLVWSAPPFASLFSPTERRPS
ncbi:hypothetical protein K503DRAFT_774321 [Rhizopogon vinicolor AM-OR11-026]|uniref:Uncharacterized protein n=1 Tax=Rhizopogon vinicolor AM-OR11-026 TaxID=1314800 RepID=A0A1B7MPX6_9AGAM|nr:hypothetical protein K503DRAFT_774321 [Rhizopogon vinicolor AM-OR11-026]